MPAIIRTSYRTRKVLCQAGRFSVGSNSSPAGDTLSITLQGEDAHYALSFTADEAVDLVARIQRQVMGIQAYRAEQKGGRS